MFKRVDDTELEYLMTQLLKRHSHWCKIIMNNKECIVEKHTNRSNITFIVLPYKGKNISVDINALF